MMIPLLNITYNYCWEQFCVEHTFLSITAQKEVCIYSWTRGSVKEDAIYVCIVPCY